MTDAPLPGFLVSGNEWLLGTHEFTADAIIRFATKFDPQPFHLDAEIARHSLLGGLCASGWHTASVWMRLQRDAIDREVAERKAAGLPAPEFGPSPGFDNLRWRLPVFAGDHITYSGRTTGARRTASRPGWWVLQASQKGVNQKGETVFTFDSTGFVKYPA